MKKLLLSVLLAGFIIGHADAQSICKTRKSDSMIVEALSMISADSLKATMQSLQDMGTRFMISPNRKDVATWIMNRFLSMGITEVRLDSFQCYTNINFTYLQYDTTTWQYNVEAKITGISNPDQEIVIMGHHDCVVDVADPMIVAPGADDNASGTAAVLECARVITTMGYQPEQTFVFLATAAEELLYFGDAGSEHYAIEAMEDGRDLVMVINNDMISWNDGSWTLNLINHILSPHITELAIFIIENYTTLNYHSWEPNIQVGADLQPFLFCGYHGIYFTENYISPNYHEPTDLVESCDSSYLAEITKVNLGCMLQYDITVGLQEKVQSNSMFIMYPNPASAETSILIQNNGSEPSTVRIANQQGLEVYHARLFQTLNRINTSGLADGIYSVILNINNQSLCQKLVIINH
jgi:hypothetical protein